MTPLFDRTARRRHRDRATAQFAEHDFVRTAMLDGIVDRLAAIKRSLRDVLDLGCFDASLTVPGARIARADAGFGFASAARGVQADEDRLPFVDGAFDAVVSAGVLDTVDDLPGALALIRRALRPDGVFLGAFISAGSLATLRAVLLAAEQDCPAARLHPQIDVRAAGDLLLRAGFVLPVADTERLTVRYAGIGRLLDDLRGMAQTNVLRSRVALRRDTLQRAAQLFAERADPDGRTAETFEIVYMTGWTAGLDAAPPTRRHAGRFRP